MRFELFTATAAVGLVWAQTITVTTTVTAAAAAATTCPVCFNCKETPCSHYASCLNNLCMCPDGWGGQNCLTPTCNSPNIDALSRVLRANGTSCTCDAGFVGENCNGIFNPPLINPVCTTDDACKANSKAPLGATFVCNKEPVVWQASGMNCEVNEPTLKTIYSGASSAYISRNITDGTTFASLWYNGNEQFYCKASGCAQALVGTDYVWDCANVQCECIPGSQFCGGPGVIVNLTPIMPTIVGAMSIKFFNQNLTTGALNFAALQALFKDGLMLGPCTSGECSDPSYALSLGPTIVKPLSRSAIGGIASAFAFLALVLAALIYAKLQQRKLKSIVTPAPRTGARLRFKNIAYQVGQKEILTGVNGTAYPGRLMAILGAGKSTFLEILAGKAKSGMVFGDILVDGRQMARPNFRSISGYVDQEDLLMGTMTVRETLLFSANLRMPESISSAEKIVVVDKLISDLGLSHIAHSRIGGAGIRGISGGEKRRVSIGVELVTSPSVLFLDEPTSGLDSHNAMLVVQTLSLLAREGGKTIIFTIHQPRSDVYMLFDDVLLLSKGRVVYLGTGSDAADTMAMDGYPCPAGYNVADHLLDVATAKGCLFGDSKVDESSTTTLVKNSMEMRDRFWNQNKGEPRITHPELALEKEEFVPEAPHDVVKDSASASNSDPSSSAHLTRSNATENYSVSFITQLDQLLLRSFKILVRKPSLLLAHVSISVILGTFVGALYFKADDSLSGFQNHIGSAFFIIALIGFSSLSVVGAFTEEKLLFLRERSNGFYGPVPFFLSKVIFDIIPLRVFPTFLLGTIAFFMIGYNPTPDAFAKYISVLFLFSAECGLFCLCIACSIRDFGTATLVASISMLFQMLMAGFLINFSRIPAFLRWIQYLSLFKYTYEAMVVNDTADMRIVDNIQGISVNIPAAIILKQFGFDVASFWTNFIVSIAISLMLLILLLLLMLFRLKEKR